MAEIQATEAREADHAASAGGDAVTRIVVGLDGSPGALRALDWAGAEADRSGAELTVVGAWVYGGFGGDFIAEEDAQIVVEKAAVSVAGRYPAVNVKPKLCRESAARALIEASSGADLLVVGSRGFGGFRGLLFGSVGQHCLTHAPCSVATIRRSDDAQTDSSETNPHRIVVGVDGSDESNLSLDWAATEASRTGALLEVVGSWVFPGTSGYVFAACIGIPEAAERVVADALARVTRVAPEVVTEGKTSEDPPAVSLVHASRGADLLVVGSRGLGSFRGLLLGSVSQHVATHSHSSVVVVRGQ
jgi:nucleotide-binding universal stress UspA family protein